MKVYDVREKPFPMNKRILVYAYNIDRPRWMTDEFSPSGLSDLNQPNGKLYPHNVSHWAELPEEPVNV